MTTISFTSPVDMTSSATMRTWGSEFNTKLAAAGLTQTTDTGQVDWATVALPAVNTAIGYEIWRFNDTLQGTAPIFLKLIYWTNSNFLNRVPGINIQIGTGSNGSGTLTGLLSSTSGWCGLNANTQGTTSYPSYICYNTTYGFLGIAFKVGACNGIFMLQRSVDSTAAPTANGCAVYWGSASWTGTTTVGIGYQQGMRFISTASVSAVHQVFSFVPGNVTSSVITNGDRQIYPHWTILPELYSVLGVGTILNSEYPSGNTFTTTIIGSPVLTYLSFGNSLMTSASNNSSNYGTAMLWQ